MFAVKGYVYDGLGSHSLGSGADNYLAGGMWYFFRMNWT